ncbi:MAG: deoxyribodipyrimidine photo-lyase, partial [Gammaproteobacteria bacterium]|nr:deoxyribodipyrimidine photo-lyase [Gammaproteobacteria bacterium]
MNKVIVWFRNDLRLHDNPALHHAITAGHNIIPIYIHDPRLSPWHNGAASNWWLHHSLASLRESLEKKGSQLFLFSGAPADILNKLVQATGALAVYANRRYEPLQEEEDKHVALQLNNVGSSLISFHGNLLNEPEMVKNKSGQPYKVFTPYYKAVMALGLNCNTLAVPESIETATVDINSDTLQQLQLLPNINWYEKISRYWKPGEASALSQMDEFIHSSLKQYPVKRDIP